MPLIDASSPLGSAGLLSPPIHVQAKKLLKQAGSPELAKQAVDVAAQNESQSEGLPDDRFAKQWGFDSYLSLIEASAPVGAAKGKNWWVTAVGAGKWIVWNDVDFVAWQHPTKSDADRHVATFSAPTRRVHCRHSDA